MYLSFRTRLILFALMAILPVWLNFFKVSVDYSIPGLMVPLLDSLYQAVLVIVAKTSPSKAESEQIGDPTKPTIDLKGADVKVNVQEAAAPAATPAPPKNDNQ